jgi:8-oxo-dGTP pyrophosphatase MutT (NUDIX family)
LAWADSYLGRLRAVAGDDNVLLLVGARCVVKDDAGRLLLIQRNDNGHWAFPAGALELGDSIAECAIREVFEETGLRVTALTPFALYSGKQHTVTNPYGHTYQLHVHAFRVDAWEGDLVRTTDETLDAGFFDLDDLPTPLSGSVPYTMADLARFEAGGTFILG